MSARTLNWLKFGGLVTMAFALGLLFAGLLDLPSRSSAQEQARATTASVITPVQAPSIPQARMLSDLSDAFAAVAEQVRPSVVYIRSQRTERTRRRVPPGMEPFFRNNPHRPDVERGSGSGFIVSGDGYILTNNHVVEGADKVTVRLFDRREFDAKVIGADPLTDVAVVKINAPRLTAAALGNSDNTRIGDWVLAIGNPLGEEFTFTVTSGIISGKGRRLQGLQRSALSIGDFIQTDAAINPGNSGGPLVNVRGEVVGINSAIASETGYYSGYGFAIPMNLAKTVMNQLVATGKVQRAALGIQVNDAKENDAAYVGLKEIRGVVINGFPEGITSPAERAGMQPGDVIVTIDGQRVDYVAQLQQVVGFRKPGDEVKVEVARKGGVRKTFAVRLMAQEDDNSDNQQEPVEQPKAAPDDAVSYDEIGIAAQSITPTVAQEYDLGREIRGVLVTEVDPNGPAYQELSAPDEGGPDIITTIEGNPVRTEAEFKAALKAAGRGAIVTLKVYNQRVNASRIVRLRLK
ncbi:MAG TPA: Do family serine endopeptidase [Gemmatimonadales bacterium]|nr:Do family serine endopeptidase [Gemmatimonadales bacterium]